MLYAGIGTGLYWNTNTVHKKIVKAVKEGLLAVNVERGYNVGSDIVKSKTISWCNARWVQVLQQWWE